MDTSLFKSIGKDVVIGRNAVIRKPENVEIGNHVIIDVLSYINVTVKCKIGDHIHIGPYASIIGREFEAEPFTVVSTGARMMCSSDEFHGNGIPGSTLPLELRAVYGNKIMMKRCSCVCTNAVVLPDVTLAEGSVVSAGSILAEDTEPWTIYGGIPALPLKKRKKDFILEKIKELGY